MDWYSETLASSAADWNVQSVSDVKRKLITANHILHQQGVVDAYGHISVRCPGTPDRYLMCGYMAPGLVTSPDDLIEYWVKDSLPTSPLAKKGYSERFIHGEMFKKFPAVNCVVHSHAEAVLPYVTSGVPLMPVFHMAGFLGNDVPVFDIGTVYNPGEQQDLLVRDSRLGSALAFKFAKDETEVPSPEHSVVLMRGHGYTTHGKDIETAVYRAIYTKVNAGVQTNAMLLRSALPSTIKAKFELEPLTEEMCHGCIKMNEGTQDKPWKLWAAEVEKSALYVNRG
ncbi:class II aldolase and Adducin N-terminal domain-containing protein [Lasiosphaeris hirsuta]|uniref:Class II aldolase and Adducin N-terminal domain-containing protein n=1 Tax=Lasiosphaeris hirsuta TaxID=260670 RepID=A0AA39ZSQ7_9PEZI|nr:class II aldolase and Adducin N-terminal domain-containing protein [Lasiosphaeris hirsuta]